MRKILCAHNHRMVEIVRDLYLCACSSYGRLSNLKGAVADARALVDRQGGIERIVDRVEREEARVKAKRAAHKPIKREVRQDA